MKTVAAVFYSIARFGAKHKHEHKNRMITWITEQHLRYPRLLPQLITGCCRIRW